MQIQVYKLRLYPTEEQKVLLEKHFGCSRFVYNWALDYKTKYYKEHRKNIHWMKISSSQDYKDFKKENIFLKEVNSQSIINSIGNLDNAYKNFFEGRASFPKFKKKQNEQSFQVPQHGRIDFKKKKLLIPKFTRDGGIPIIIHRKIPKGKHGTYTISKTPFGNYYVSVMVHRDIILSEKPKPKNAIGLDFGLKTFITVSNGHKIKNPEFLKHNLKSLAKQQRKLSKKQDRSKNKEKQRIKVAKLQETISNQRKDYLHKLSYKYANESQIDTICIENLNIQGMQKRWGRKISDLSWHEFTRMLEYKCEWYGKNLIKIGRFDPSSKTCSACGNVQSLKLNDRKWKCNECAAVHDRDINAAINIRDFGMNQYQLPSGRGDVKPVEKKALTKKNRKKTPGVTNFNESGKVQPGKVEANTALAV